MRSLAVIRTCCVVGLLALGGALAAQSKPSLIGATRAQVVARFGEPKSNIVAGDREVLFFATERVVLRNDRVVEVEDIETAPPPKPAPAAQSPTEEPQAKTATSNPSVATALATGNVPAAVAAATQPSAHAADAATATTAPAASEGAAPSVKSLAPAVAPEPEVIIKSIRPPSAVAHDPAAASTAIVAPVPIAPAGPNGPRANAGVGSASQPPSPPGPAHTVDAPAATPGNATSVRGNATVETAPEPVGATQATTSAADASAKLADDAKGAPAVAVRPTPPPNAAADARVPSLFTAREYAIAAVLIGGGIGYLVWRRRNRRLMLAATAVSQPFSAAPLVPAGGRFTADLLNRLDPGSFEQLVAAYYNKTGVVATRANAGPASPVHVRISWKGEPRPFAYVHCIARPTALVGAEPVEALCQVLAAEDIRRGYIVTAGKFSVTARDLAEEKHVTLLSGDIFLEKLNALPDPARAELMRGVTQGDATIAMCPKCDIKMMRSPTDAGAWQCAQCGTTLPRG